MVEEVDSVYMLQALVLPVHHQESSWSLSETSAVMLQGQGTHWSCRVDRAVKSEKKVSSVRRKEA